MHLAVETYNLRKRLGDTAAIDLIRDAGFDGIDYSFFGIDENDTMLGNDYLDIAHRVRAQLDDCGLQCHQAHAPFVFVFGDTMDMSGHKYAQVVRAIEFAAILGAHQIIVHAIPTPDDVDFIQYNWQYYSSFVPYLETHNIRIAVENLFTFDSQRNACDGLLGTPEELTTFVQSLPSAHFTTCLDIGHAAITGTEPQDFIAAMTRQTLGALHVHDNDYHLDRHWLPCTGEMNWDAITQALGEIGYAGDFTLEIPAYLAKFDDALLPDALRLAERTGRHLIQKIEAHW